jgi:hypothetical protein
MTAPRCSLFPHLPYGLVAEKGNQSFQKPVHLIGVSLSSLRISPSHLRFKMHN